MAEEEASRNVELVLYRLGRSPDCLKELGQKTGASQHTLYSARATATANITAHP